MEKATIALELAVRLIEMAKHAHKTGNDIPNMQLIYALETAKVDHENWINSEGKPK